MAWNRRSRCAEYADWTGYYPNSSRRAREVGEVVVHFTIGPNGDVGSPISVDRSKSAAFPRLQMAASQIVESLRFQPEKASKNSFTASIVFELTTCGKLAHTGSTDYQFNLCLAVDPALSQAQGNVTPSCYGTPYAAQKAKSRTPVEVPQIAASLKPDPSSPPNVRVAKNRIRVQPNPLESPPPEIARIERGYTSEFVGAFINDGLASWFGIDLDRMQVVSVQRHIYDKRSSLTRPFVGPTFQWWDERSFARQWSDADRSEMEAVVLGELRAADANAFVCLANKIWERNDPSAEDIPQQSDTLASSSTLVDTLPMGGKSFRSVATVLPGGPLSSVIAAIETSLPKLESK